MKTLRLSLVALCFAAVAAIAATTYTKQTARVGRFQAETTFNAAGAATAVNVDAFLQVLVVNDTDSSDSAQKPWVPVRFDLLDPLLTSVNITAATKTVTYPQLAALLRQAALDRATAQGISP